MPVQKFRELMVSPSQNWFWRSRAHFVQLLPVRRRPQSLEVFDLQLVLIDETKSRSKFSGTRIDSCGIHFAAPETAQMGRKAV
jgi:hypothetical protein